MLSAMVASMSLKDILETQIGRWLFLCYFWISMWFEYKIIWYNIRWKYNPSEPRGEPAVEYTY